jgi:hypothetical protein
MKNGLASLGLLLFTCTSSVLVGQTKTSTTEIPIAPVVRNAIDAAHKQWKEETASAFSPGLTYVKGVPVVMLITDVGEGKIKKAARKQAIVEILDSLLDDEAFSLATICIVESEKGKSVSSTRSYQVARLKYLDAVKKSAKLDKTASRATVSKSVEKTKQDFGSANDICKDLGIE